MDWVRKHIKTGSRLALFALAIQFVLAFGHVHVARAQPASASDARSYIQLVSAAIEAESGFVAAAPVAADDHGLPQNRTSDDDCAICAVLALSAATLFGASPVLHLPDAVKLIYRATDAGFAHLDPAHAVFQPRAPPVS